MCGHLMENGRCERSCCMARDEKFVGQPKYKFDIIRRLVGDSVIRSPSTPAVLLGRLVGQ